MTELLVNTYLYSGKHQSTQGPVLKYILDIPVYTLQ